MNSKFVKICSAIGISAAITLGDINFDYNDISSIDSYTPSKFFEGIEKLSTADELVSTLADVRMYSHAGPAPAELGGIIGVGDGAQPGATSSETSTSANATTPAATTTTAPSSESTATPAATNPMSTPSAPSAPTAPSVSIKESSTSSSTSSNSTAKVTTPDPILDDKPSASVSNSTDDDQAFGASDSAPAASSSTNSTASKSTTSSSSSNSTKETCTDTGNGMNSCTGQSGQAESASANNTVRAINNVTMPEDDAATVSDTLTKNGTKENFTASASSTNTTNSTTKEQVDAIKAGAVIPEPSNVTVPTLKTNDTDGAAIKVKEPKKPCPFDQPKVV